MSRAILQRPMLGLSVFVMATTLALGAEALPLDVRPIDLGDGLVASGQLVTDDLSGSIVDWQLRVRSTTRLAHFTRANTPLLGIDQTAVSNDGQRLTVASSPDPANLDGGQLRMRSANPSLDFGTVLADFSGANAAGGQAQYMAGAAFDFLDLGVAPATDYLVATRSGAALPSYTLTPLSFADGVTVSGSLLTDGTIGALGAANVLGWDIYVDQVFEDIFDKSNSTMLAIDVAFDASLGAVLVNNPDGILSFAKPALGGRAHALTLADFADPLWPTGKAAYYQGRLSINERALGAPAGAWRVTGADPLSIPEPPALALSLCGLLLCAARTCLIRDKSPSVRQSKLS